MKQKWLASLIVGFMLVILTMSAAFAASSVSVSGPGTVEPGETIQVTISASGDGANGSVSAQGLEFVSTSSQLSAAGAFVLLPVMGSSSVIYTYRVTAQSGSVAVTLSNVKAAEDDEAVPIPGDSWIAKVQPPVPPTEPPTQTPTDPPPTEPPTNPPTVPPTNPPTEPPTQSPTNSPVVIVNRTTPKPTPKQVKTTASTKKEPKTGDPTANVWEFAVIGAGCAATAVVAGKKVFQK